MSAATNHVPRLLIPATYHVIRFTCFSTQFCKSLLTFMYKYIQFIDFSRAGNGGFRLCCWLRNISRERHTADVTSPNAAHAYCIVDTSRAHRAEYRYIQECLLLSYKVDSLRSHDCGHMRGNMPTTQEHRRHTCHVNLLPQRHVVCQGRLCEVTLSERFLAEV